MAVMFMKSWLMGLGLVLCSVGAGMLLSGTPGTPIDSQQMQVSGYRLVTQAGMFKNIGAASLIVGLILCLVSKLWRENGSDR